ncbi:hypothetical protein M316_0025 [Nitrincola phage 1M3-16]|uniref:hypothetical protein n=1 Tax=Nitrincola phage 1M3-16 TaxID=1472912 RepID=UPI000444CEBA|nr:hypothetical protein GJ22_gp127 [Nitrincola phage 1M3-16]AHX01090.1 hypothetical protein M316_0025 [Nitrincola phage 1M3-16]
MAVIETKAAKAQSIGKSSFRGHTIIWAGDKWLYEDNQQPIPGYGGEMRPCKKCGSTLSSNDGFPDECLGSIKGVTNACCGHGDTSVSYMVFDSGLVIEGFEVTTECRGGMIGGTE